MMLSRRTLLKLVAAVLCRPLLYAAARIRR